ncbi:hypothetical protein EIP86_010198 [Pleurotus ostreatoroseus]|nr:hypothetical protein EIP86_010198 [Pleurotus ostreatoroseus]
MLKQTFMSSRSRICCTLFLIGYPFFSIAASSFAAAIGLTIAGWKSQDGLTKAAAIVCFVGPLTLLPCLIWTQMAPTSDDEDVHREDTKYLTKFRVFVAPPAVLRTSTDENKGVITLNRRRATT